jgi:hypothetical protein
LNSKLHLHTPSPAQQQADTADFNSIPHLHTPSAVRQVIDECESVAKQMRERLAPLLEAAHNGSMRANSGRISGNNGSMAQPRLMSGDLRMLPHQLVGLSWLRGLQQVRHVAAW